MTKCEIRKAVMNEARIEEDSIVLDVGAGTGSISIEAALAAPKGHVYAIERFDKGIDLINENMKKFNVNNMTVIKSKLLKAWKNCLRLMRLSSAVVLVV